MVPGSQNRVAHLGWPPPCSSNLPQSRRLLCPSAHGLPPPQALRLPPPPLPRELREPGPGPGADPLPGGSLDRGAPCGALPARPLGCSPVHTHSARPAVPLRAAGASGAGRWVPAPSRPQSLCPTRRLLPVRPATKTCSRGSLGWGQWALPWLRANGAQGRAAGGRTVPVSQPCRGLHPQWACGTRVARVYLARSRRRLPACCWARGAHEPAVGWGGKGSPRPHWGTAP